ncbi:hypothetical protein KXS11_13800 [Plantibacter flavus]
MHAATAVALVLGLSACGTPPWEQPGMGSSSSPSTSKTPKPTVSAITNELATGSAQHSLVAGPATLTVDYWSTLSMDAWTADVNKPVSFSLSGVLNPDDLQALYLSRVTLTTTVHGPDGQLDSPAPFTDQSTVSPGYLIKAPYSYSQTFVLPEVDSTATGVTLTITYELLVQTTPTSAEYAKQTAVDTLTIAIAPKP